MDANGSKQDENTANATDQVIEDKEIDPCPVRVPNSSRTVIHPPPAFAFLAASDWLRHQHLKVSGVLHPGHSPASGSLVPSAVVETGVPEVSSE